MIQQLLATDNVLLFIPNIIGYARIILLFLALPLLSHASPFPSMSLYCLSAILDALDGYAGSSIFNISTSVQSIHSVWCSAGYGDRSGRYSLLNHIYRCPNTLYGHHVATISIVGLCVALRPNGRDAQMRATKSQTDAQRRKLLDEPLLHRS